MTDNHSDKSTQLLEKLTEYVMNEVTPKQEMNSEVSSEVRNLRNEVNLGFSHIRNEMNTRFNQVETALLDTLKDIHLILNCMENHVKENEIVKTEWRG